MNFKIHYDPDIILMDTNDDGEFTHSIPRSSPMWEEVFGPWAENNTPLPADSEPVEDTRITAALGRLEALNSDAVRAAVTSISTDAQTKTAIKHLARNQMDLISIVTAFIKEDVGD
ncbi:MAG: hypothetical protein KAS32_17170 [Candidatus Peribacteraceae bacterium]|nr:hypothetical protein [Candidatus Peribacteraceae bacterium]